MTLSIVGSAVGVTLIVASSLIHLQTETLYEKQCDSMAAISRQVPDTIKDMVTHHESLLNMAAQDECFREMNIKRIRRYLFNATERFPAFVSFSLFGRRQGETLLQVDASSSRFGTDPNRRVYTKRAVLAMGNDSEFYVSPTFYSCGRPMISIMTRICNETEQIGTLCSVLDITKFSKILSEMRIGDGHGYAYIVDKTGCLIAHPDFLHVANHEKWENVEGVRLFLSAKGDPDFKPVRYRARNGTEVIGIYNRINPMGWGIIVEQSVSSIYEPINRMIVSTILWLIAAVIILISLTVYLSRRITRPLLALKDGVQEFANGNWEVFFDTKTGDEIQSLAEAFNSMAANLKHLYGKLHQEIKRVSLSEEALRRSEEEYRGIFENAAEGISRSTLDGKFLIVNPALVQMLGYDSQNELLALNIGDDVYASRAERELFISLLKKDGLVKNFETTLRRKDRTPIWVSLNAHALRNTTGEVIGSECITSDITKRKRAEELRHELEEFNTRVIHAIPSFICVVEPDFRLSFVSEHAERFFGRPVQEIIGKWGLCHFGCVHKENRICQGRPNCVECRNVSSCRTCTLRLAAVDLFTKGKETIRKEITLKIIDTNGNEIEKTILFSVLSLHWGGEKVALLIMDDITQHKQLENQLFQAHKMESIGLLAGGIAHDFNNLLTGIMGFTSLLLTRMERTRPEYAHVKYIDQACQRASDLVQQLLTFGRRVPSNPIPLQLNSLIKETGNLLTRIIPKNIVMEIRCNERLWMVHIDPAQIQQVIMNVCINARDAMPNGGTLTIETDNFVLSESGDGVQPGRYVVSTISDSGIGMSREIRERIFEPFFTTKGLGKGTGLGLAVAYATVKNHQGFIKVDTEIGSGTIFKIYLPAIEDVAEIGEEEPKELPSGSETILMVDDEPLVLNVACNILEDFGYQVIPMADPVKAVDIYEERRGEIDLVILDLVMPRMGGVECLRELLRINPFLKAILTSGYSINEDVQDSIRNGAKAFVKKPFDVTALLVAVRQAIDASE